jgi:4-hydroxybenzoate polyprenyltransferase
MKRVLDLLSLVKFSHSIFALPFALQGAWLAARGVPPLEKLAWIVLCAVAARTAAMAFNRLVDRRFDAANPRTAARELPAGKLSVASVASLVVLATGIFVAAAFQLGRLCGWLSFPVIALLLAYSFVKRWSFLAHAVLGLALALAPLGAWLGVRGDLRGDVVPVLVLAFAVWSWVAGFDLIYACQDVDFDRRTGLHSVPARFGIGHTLRLSTALHVLTVGALIFVALRADLSWVFGASVVLAAILLAWEHRIVRSNDLSRVDLAFFTLNGWVGVGLFLGMAIDLARQGGGG